MSFRSLTDFEEVQLENCHTITIALDHRLSVEDVQFIANNIRKMISGEHFYCGPVAECNSFPAAAIEARVSVDCHLS